MELITEIYNEDIGVKESSGDKIYKLRKASRAVIFNDSNEIALLFVGENNYHKLPGGGIEKGEDIHLALKREALEEAAVEIDIIDEVGTIIEYRDNFEQLQISYCFTANVTRKLDSTAFTEEELSKGFELKWLNLEEAIELIQNDKPNDYMGKFIQKRDFAFLMKARKVVNLG